MVHGGASNNAQLTANQQNADATAVAAAEAAGVVVDNAEKTVVVTAADADDSSAESPVQCSICLKTFAKAQQLNVHISTAHAIQTTTITTAVTTTTAGNENDEEDPNGTDKITDIAME